MCANVGLFLMYFSGLLMFFLFLSERAILLMIAGEAIFSLNCQRTFFKRREAIQAAAASVRIESKAKKKKEP